MFVCPSVRMEQLGIHWPDFHDIWYLNLFRISVDNIQAQLKSNEQKGTLCEDVSTVVITDCWEVADRSGQTREWAVDNMTKINPGKSKAISFTTARVKDPLN